MTEERLAYRPASSGHDGEGRRRKEYKGANYPLFDAFRGWIERVDEKSPLPYAGDGFMEMFADEALRDVPLEGATCEEINEVLPPFDGHPCLVAAGIFLSDAYRRAGIRDAVFESSVDARIHTSGHDIKGIGHLGRNLPQGHSLVLKGRTGIHTGYLNKGTILNYGTCAQLGEFSKSLLVNYGKIEGSFGMNAGGTAITFGHVGAVATGEYMCFIRFGGELCNFEPEISILWHSDMNTYTLTLGVQQGRPEPEHLDVPEELKAYLDKLKDQTGPHRSPQEVIESTRDRNIRKEILDILEMEDYEDNLGI